MANVVAGNPFIIDTITATVIYADKFRLSKVIWTSGSTADVANIQDAAGIVRWAGIGGKANDFVQSDFLDEPAIMFNGLKVQTLGVGTLYIYVERQ